MTGPAAFTCLYGECPALLRLHSPGDVQVFFFAWTSRDKDLRVVTCRHGQNGLPVFAKHSILQPVSWKKKYRETSRHDFKRRERCSLVLPGGNLFTARLPCRPTVFAIHVETSGYRPRSDCTTLSPLALPFYMWAGTVGTGSTPRQRTGVEPFGMMRGLFRARLRQSVGDVVVVVGGRDGS